MAGNSKYFKNQRQRQLFLDAQKTLGPLNYKPVFFYGDGYEGLPSYEPFDRILVTAAAPEIPSSLLSQLAIGGILVIPEGNSKGQKMIRVVKKDEEQFERTEHGHFSFVPLLRGKNQ